MFLLWGGIGRVRAKFKVSNKQDNKVELQVVIDGSEENKQFWKYTPSGQISIHIDNETAREKFEVGKEYYVDFTLAE